jgi:hypothetical protein
VDVVATENVESVRKNRVIVRLESSDFVAFRETNMSLFFFFFRVGPHRPVSGKREEQARRLRQRRAMRWA